MRYTERVASPWTAEALADAWGSKRWGAYLKVMRKLCIGSVE